MIYCKSIRYLLPVFLLVAIFGIQIQAQQATAVPTMTYENVSYGDHPNHVIDFWEADIEAPAPLVVFIHGGGFTGGSHDKVAGKKIQQYLDAGIHHVNFGIIMEDKLRREGVEVFLKYPQTQLPFENDVAFLIHHLKK